MYGETVCKIPCRNTSACPFSRFYHIDSDVDDVKGNTYPYGISQTGKACPNSELPDSMENIDGSYIEFFADADVDNGMISEYVVADIIVYKRKL